MANNEFKVKNGLIVTGSTYVSESIFAPRLPQENNPNYFVTWVNADGRFEVSAIGPGASANVLSCWTYVAEFNIMAAQKWTTNDGSVGSSTTQLYLSQTDNYNNNLFNTLNSFGIGSVVNLYVDNFSTTFEITGKLYTTSPTNEFIFNVRYLSGNQYTPVGEPIMCLSLAAAVAPLSQCLALTMSTTYSGMVSNSGGSVFLTDNGNSISYGASVSNTTTNGIMVNPSDLNGVNTINFFQGLNVGDQIKLTWTTNQTIFEITYISPNIISNPANQLVNFKYVSGNFGYTISNGNRYSLCALL
jgi:hypothetical protein